MYGCMYVGIHASTNEHIDIDIDTDIDIGVGIGIYTCVNACLYYVQRYTFECSD